MSFMSWKIWNFFTGPPSKPVGCKCMLTCPECKRWSDFVKKHAPTCPGNEADYYFNVWENTWIYNHKK